MVPDKYYGEIMPKKKYVIDKEIINSAKSCHQMYKCLEGDGSKMCTIDLSTDYAHRHFDRNRQGFRRYCQCPTRLEAVPAAPPPVSWQFYRTARLFSATGY